MTEQQQAGKIEELQNFPFKTFAEYKKAALEGVAGLGIDRSVAMNWSYRGGLYAASSVKFKATLYMLLPFVSAIGLIVYIVASGSWWLLLSLPLVMILYFLFHPSAGMIFGPIRTLFIALSFFGLAYGFYASKWWMFALCLSLVLMWYGQKSVYANGVKYLMAAANEHEDLLCRLWQSKAANVQFFNGDYYYVDHKKVDGKFIHYE